MQNIFTIFIEQLEIEAIIGILDFERTRMQKIVIDCTITYKRDGDEFINYAEVAGLVESMLVDGKYKLIEDALTEIITAIKKSYPKIMSVKLKLCKPEILANCSVCVEKLLIY